MIGHHRVGRAGSPVGDGLMALPTAVAGSARLRGHAGAFRVTPEGENLLDEPWATAGNALLHALALGAPGLVSGAEAAVLTTAWRALQGHAGQR